MKSAVFYILGAVSGAVATYFIMKNRMEQQIQNEVEAFKDDYKEYKSNVPEINMKDNSNEERAKKLIELNMQKKQDIMRVRDITERQNYNAFSNPPKEEDIDTYYDSDDDASEADYPREGLADYAYVITPDQFVNECPFFDKITLEYFKDGILADALTEEIIEDIDSCIGKKSLEKFGEYEENVVYVRNEKRNSDYEVIHQDRPFVTLPEDE